MILNKIFSGLFVQKLLMTCSRSPEDVFDFFQDVKNWESGGIITSVTKVDNDLWTCSTPAGKAQDKEYS
jgi:hypothetical protein